MNYRMGVSNNLGISILEYYLVVGVESLGKAEEKVLAQATKDWKDERKLRITKVEIIDGKLVR